MFDEDQLLPLSALQHWLYCPRQCGLIHLEQAWAENKFTAEGQYCVDARDATWAKLLEILAEIQAGTRPRPSGYADIEPELPLLVWPN